MKKILIEFQYQSPSVTALPERAKGLYPHVGLKNGAYLHGYAPLTLRPPIKSVGQFPSGSAYGAEGCQLVYISFVSLRQAEASSRRVLHDTMGQMDAMV